jgi:peptide chain release factor 3
MEKNIQKIKNKEIANRRTFAIISHPDAGKTTLTEKLLLYGNAIDLAGNVRARRNQRNTTSDWMEMERQRGISITSTVLQFPYQDHIINLLDTPGHQDFSEDTYRTLSAVDSAVMVLDAAKGIEPQTRKLFDVCRQRGIPIFTFINKMDRPARSPLELLDEIENVLGMQPVPINWPLGDGINFKGVYDRRKAGIYLFERTLRNEKMSPEKFYTFKALLDAKLMNRDYIDQVQSDIELLDGLGIEFNQQRMLNEEQTPVYFGSALTNFGVRLFLESFIHLAPAPQPYESDLGLVSPSDEEFSGFVFKIQANMNPKHRDSVAFLRICSGKFSRGMDVIHTRTGKTIKLQRPYKLFANEREIIEEAYPGDVLGIPNTGELGIGDTLSEKKVLKFAPIPRFHPEHFALLRLSDLGKQKQFLKGLRQLEMEGAVQVLYNVDAFKREPILAVVGELQFDVVQARLENEYNVPTSLERLSIDIARWVKGPEEDIKRINERSNNIVCLDSQNKYVALFHENYHMNLVKQKYPSLVFEMQNST